MTGLRRAIFIAVIIAVIVGPLLFGFLTMTDPAPKLPQPEGRPDYVGQADVPETSPIG